MAGSSTNGTVTMLANGDIQFVPNANYHGAAQFTYTVNDDNGGTANANVNLTVLAVNDAPIATGETVSGAVEAARQHYNLLRDDLRRIIKRTGVTALYVTHDQAEAVVLDSTGNASR